MVNFTFDSTAQFQTNRLLLRKFRNTDIEDMLKNWISDPDVQSGYGEPAFTSPQQVAELLKSWEGQYRWAIILKETGENIGHVSFCRLYAGIGVAEVEYCVGKAFWGKGFITEALEAFIRHTFTSTSITKIEAFHRIGNPASGRVLQKSGFLAAENVMRFSDLTKAPEGDICYAITKEQFTESQLQQKP